MTGLSLATKVVRLHRALRDAALPHAFGGALALAWCTKRARGTIDIDLNVFVPVDRLDDVLRALPRSVKHRLEDRALFEADGQARLWWGATPVDIFMNTTPFHQDVSERTNVFEFNGASVPFLACSDLAIFKAFFNRSRDWADLEEMAAADTLDLDQVVGVITRLLGPDDERVARLLSLPSTRGPRV